MIALAAATAPSVGCDRPSAGGPNPSASAAAASAPASSNAPSASGLGPAPAAGVVVHPAARCGECHGALLEEWRTSRHAAAASSPVYQAMLAKAGADAAACRGCHTPLERFVSATDPVAAEGVTCEACHAIRSVAVSETAAGTSQASVLYAVADETKQGPRCDAKPHYFHKMGCAPLFKKAELCAGCHVWSRHVAAGDLAVFTEYDDWRKEHFAREGLPCQDCHMPGLPREVAVGARKLADVSYHGDLGLEGGLRKKTVAMDVKVSDAGEAVSVEVSLTNVGAGHAVPTGMPGQQIVLRAVSLDEAGGERDRAERAFGRVLVDAAGHEVPFTQAVKEASDQRLAPGKAHVETFSLAAPEAGKVQVTVSYRATSPAIAAALGVAKAEELAMASAEIAYGAPGRARAKLPRTVKVKP